MKAAFSRAEGVPSYEERVTRAIAELLPAEWHTDIVQLNMLLDYESYSALLEKTQEHEVIVTNAWDTALVSYGRTSGAATYAEQSILTGLLKNDRWRTLFQCEDNAYAFVIVLARYVRKGEPGQTKPTVDRDAYQDLLFKAHTAMAPWFGPGIELGAFTSLDLACALFGDAWCAFVYESCSDRIALEDVVASTRPPFAAGRLAASLSQAAHPLPELAC